MQLHFLFSFLCTGLLVKGLYIYLPFVSCDMHYIYRYGIYIYNVYIVYANAACGSWCLAPVNRPYIRFVIVVARCMWVIFNLSPKQHPR